MSAETIVSSVLSNVPKAVASGVVDMGTGMLLDVKTVDQHPQSVLDMLAAATQDLYEGDSVMGIENIFKTSRNDSTTEHYFQEVIINSKNLIHVFSRLTSNQNVVIAAICEGSANLGLVVMKMREICSKETV